MMHPVYNPTCESNVIHHTVPTKVHVHVNRPIAPKGACLSLDHCTYAIQLALYDINFR